MRFWGHGTDCGSRAGKPLGLSQDFAWEKGPLRGSSYSLSYSLSILGPFESPILDYEYDNETGTVEQPGDRISLSYSLSILGPFEGADVRQRV